MAQCHDAMSLPLYLNTIVAHLQADSDKAQELRKIKTAMEHVWKIQELVSRYDAQKAETV